MVQPVMIMSTQRRCFSPWLGGVRPMYQNGFGVPKNYAAPPAGSSRRRSKVSRPRSFLSACFSTRGSANPGLGSGGNLVILAKAAGKSGTIG